MQSHSSDNCVHCYEIEILNLVDPELQLMNTKAMINYKLKALLNEMKKFKVQTILALDDKKRNNCQIFHSSSNLIASNSEIEKTFKSMHLNIMTKIRNYAWLCLWRWDCLKRNYKA